jgi:hypothetical protein
MLLRRRPKDDDTVTDEALAEGRRQLHETVADIVAGRPKLQDAVDELIDAVASHGEGPSHVDERP